MKILKLISAVLMTAISMSLGAMINFDVINSFPMIPVYFKINNEQNWRVLNKAVYRFSMHVENDTPITVTFSPTPDNSHPTFFAFSPQVPATQTPTKQASKVPAQTNRPRHAITGFIQVHVNSLGDVIIAPQNASPTNRSQTRFGLPLAQNITYPVIAQFKEQATAAATLQVKTAPAPAASPAPTPAASSTTASVTVPPAPALPEPTAVKPATTVKTTSSTTPAAVQPTAPKTAVPAAATQKPAAQAQAKVAQPATAAASAVVKPTTTGETTSSTTPAAVQPTAPKTAVPAAAAHQEASGKKQIVLPADPIFATLNIRESDEQTQTVLKFFNNLLDRVLAQAKSIHNHDGLNVVGTQIVIPTPDSLDFFKDGIRAITELTLEDEILIDQVWELICINRADKDKDGKIIANRINRILANSLYMHGITTLSELFAKFSATKGLDQQIWQDLGPVQKLFYLKCIFYRATIDKASKKIDSEASKTSQSHEIKTPTGQQAEAQAPQAKYLTLEKEDASTAAPSRTMAQQQDSPKDKTPTTSKGATVDSTSAIASTTTHPVEQAPATLAGLAKTATIAYAVPQEDIPADAVFEDLKIAQKDPEAQTILKFFNMLVRVLQQARATNNDRACLTLDRMITAGKKIKDAFKEIVRDTMKQLTPEDENLIEQTWSIIGENKHTDDPKHTVIAQRIISFLATQENMKGIDTLSALMAKFQPKQGLAETVWNQLTPMQKLFYLKCIFFKVTAENMYEQITADLQQPGE